MRKKLVRIQIIQTIFMIILFVIAILEKNGIIQREKSFMPFYIISCLIYWIILDVIICITMYKNNKKEKKIFIFGVVLSIEILLLGVFCGSIDNRVDLIGFTKHCKETTSTIYDIDKSISSGWSNGEEYHCTLTYTYRLKYYVNGLGYTAHFSESHDGRGKSQHSAKSNAEINDPRYEIGDEFIIYYNTKNPEDYRRNIGYASENLLNIFAFIIIGLRGFVLGKGIMEYNKEKRI